MSNKKKPLPANPTANEIVKRLERVLYSGFRPSEMFDDWLELVEGTLSMLPAHALALAESGKMAEDTPEVAAIFQKMRKRYDAQTFEAFSEALALLIASTETHQDLLGQMFMQYGAQSQYHGQFFTPYPVAQMMAMMTIGEIDEANPPNEPITILDPAAGRGYC